MHAGGGAAGEEGEGKENGPELLTWTTILCRRSTLTACMAYVLTSCIYIVYGAHYVDDIHTVLPYSYLVW